MGRKRKTPDDGDVAILLVLEKSQVPVTSDAIYEAVRPLFPDRRMFARALGGLTKRRAAFVKRVSSEVRMYSLDPANGDDFGERQNADKKATKEKNEPTLRIDQLYTRQAAAMIAGIRAKSVKPSAQNNPDKKRETK